MIYQASNLIFYTHVTKLLLKSGLLCEFEAKLSHIQGDSGKLIFIAQ